jgi:hypothetical protein
LGLLKNEKTAGEGLTKAGGRRQKAVGYFCNGDFHPDPKTFRLKRRGFRPDCFDNSIQTKFSFSLTEFSLNIAYFEMDWVLPQSAELGLRLDRGFFKHSTVVNGSGANMLKYPRIFFNFSFVWTSLLSRMKSKSLI